MAIQVRMRLRHQNAPLTFAVLSLVPDPDEEDVECFKQRCSFSTFALLYEQTAMPTTVEIPTLQELKVDEINVSSAVLKAAAHHYGSQCDKPNKEFMLCRWEEKDPRKCLEEGRKVNECALNFFRQIKGNCAESFTEYWTCLDYSNLAELRHCRKQQQAFDSCVLDKLGWERPELGDLSKVTKVSTARPLPENPYHSRPRPEPNPAIEGKLEPAKHGSKLFFWNW